jgi:hypothetical protein
MAFPGVNNDLAAAVSNSALLAKLDMDFPRIRNDRGLDRHSPGALA